MAVEQLSLGGSSRLGQTWTQPDVSQGKDPACSLGPPDVSWNKPSLPCTEIHHRCISSLFRKETMKQIYSFLFLSLKQVDSDS